MHALAGLEGLEGGGCQLPNATQPDHDHALERAQRLVALARAPGGDPGIGARKGQRGQLGLLVQAEVVELHAQAPLAAERDDGRENTLFVRAEQRHRKAAAHGDVHIRRHRQPQAMPG